MIEDRMQTFARAHMRPRSALGDDMLLEGYVDPPSKTKTPTTPEEAEKAQQEAYSEFEREALGV
jgi:hypothetical protein